MTGDMWRDHNHNEEHIELYVQADGVQHEQGCEGAGGDMTVAWAEVCIN